MFWSVLVARSYLRRRAQSEAGFGMIELLAAMTVMLIGIFAVFSLFQAGIVQIRRASTVTTAGAIADSEMENFRAIKYEAIGLASSNVTSVVGSSYGSTYTGQTAFYTTDSAATTTLTAAMTASQLTIPVASGTGFPSTGPFLVKIDSELILVNDRTTTPWTVRVVGERGYLNDKDSSYYGAAAAHSAGATVSWVQRVDVKACGATPCTQRRRHEDGHRRRRALVQGGHLHHLEADHELGHHGGPARQAGERRRPRQRLPVPRMGPRQRLVRRGHGLLDQLRPPWRPD